MTSPRCRLNGARESRPAGPINLQENPSTTSAIRQTRSLRGRRNLQCVRGLGVFQGRLFSLPAQAEILTLTHGEVQIRDIRGGDTASKDIDTVLLGNSAVVEV